MALDTQQLTMLLDILGREMLQKVHQSYLADSQTKMQQLQQAIAESDCPTVDHLSHSLKSASANLAMSDLASIFAQMEAQAAQGEHQDLAELYQAAQIEYQRALGQLSEALAS